MAWVRTPDELWEREEVLALGLEAVALHQAALGYSNRNLTDGRIPSTKAAMLVPLADVSAVIARLVAAGWWTVTETGYQLVYLLDLQPTAASVLAKREKNARSVAAYRARSHGMTHTLSTPRVAALPGTRSPDPEPGSPVPEPGSPVPEPAHTAAPDDASGGTAARAASPRRKPKTATQEKLATIVDLVRVAGVPIHPTSRDGSALKSCAAPPELVAEAYVAAARGVWDPVGDGFLRGNLSVHLVVGRIAGYLAERQPVKRDYLAGLEDRTRGPGHNVHGAGCDCAYLSVVPPSTERDDAVAEFAF